MSNSEIQTANPLFACEFPASPAEPPVFATELEALLEGRDGRPDCDEIWKWLQPLAAVRPVAQIAPSIQTWRELFEIYLRFSNEILYDPGVLSCCPRAYDVYTASEIFATLEAQICLGFDRIHPRFAHIADLLRNSDPERLRACTRRQYDIFLWKTMKIDISMKLLSAELEGVGITFRYSSSAEPLARPICVVSIERGGPEEHVFWIEMGEKMLGRLIHKTDDPPPWLFQSDSIVSTGVFIQRCMSRLGPTASKKPICLSRFPDDINRPGPWARLCAAARRLAERILLPKSE